VERVDDLTAASEGRAQAERRLLARAAATKRRTIPPRPQGGPPPLSFAQERMFLLEQLTPGVSAYNVPRLLRVPATLDDEALERAFLTVVARHEPLRSSVRLEDGTPVLRVLDEPRLSFAAFDLRGSADPDGEVQRIVDEVAWAPFDLGHDPMLRVALLHLGAGEDLLAIVGHHLVSDHGSTGVLFRELAEAYAAAIEGAEPDLPELPIAYGDFAAWQRARLGGDGLSADLDYWRETLHGAPERIELPTDRPRPSVKSYRGAVHQLTLEPALVEELRTLARSRSASMFVVLLAGMNALLHRYGAGEDVVVGSPISGRHHEETMGLIGFFTNTLALRTSLEGDPSFAELVDRVRATTFSAYAHQELPFERLVEALNPQRDLSHTPFFQVLFAHDVEPEPLRLAGVACEAVPLPTWPWARFDLSLGVQERSDGSTRVTVEYSADLFQRETAERLARHFATLLRLVAADPEVRIASLSLLDADEERELLEGRNATAAPLDERCLHELVAEQATLRPDAVALEGSGVILTYSELDRRAGLLARRLHELGVERGSVVGICMERVPEVVLSMLAVLKAGAAYVPVDPTYPAERQEFMLADAGVPVVLTQERLLDRLAAPPAAAVICVDRDRETIESAGAEPYVAAATSDDIAYVIYTSGSTGRPKGVEIRHRSVVNLMGEMRQRPGLDAGDTVVNVTTTAFDLSVPDVYLPLVCGARLVILPRETTLDPALLGTALASVGATFMQATPTTWGMLVETGWEGLQGLKIVCGGEALSRALANELVDRGESLWHMYGPTETTVWSSIGPLRRGSSAPPIAGPIANTRFYVVDENLRPVPLGVPGELLIGGAGVARGYRNRPELTAERFVADPFVDDPEARVYRTGDRFRWRADGTLEFLGRLDAQVKLHGFRIELGEVEAALEGLEGVRSAAAAIKDAPTGDQVLVGYVVAEEGAELAAEEVRRSLAAELPTFMVPSAVLLLDELPVTANRKLDRAALPAPDEGRRTEVPYLAPRTPVEEQLAEIWADVLSLERVGVHDDFFALGGHSLLALKMLARVQATFGLDLYVTVAFERPTVAALAELVSERLLQSAPEDELASLLDELESIGGA